MSIPGTTVPLPHTTSSPHNVTMNTSAVPAITFKTKFLMTTSAGFMGLLGLSASVLPQEILAYVGVQPDGPLLVLAGIAGALYLGFAVLNWMAREHLIGGIYSRPVALGNFAHFFVAAVALTEQVLATPTVPVAVITTAYVLFAAAFGSVVFAGGTKCG